MISLLPCIHSLHIKIYLFVIEFYYNKIVDNIIISTEMIFFIVIRSNLPQKYALNCKTMNVDIILQV